MKAGERAFQSFKFAKAEEEFQAALAQTQSFPANGRTDLRTAETLGKLAEVYTREAKFADAEDALKRDAAVTEATVGPDDSRLAYVLINLGLDYARENKADEAAPLWTRSVAILKKSAKPVDAGVLSSMESVAVDLLWRGSNPKCEEQIWNADLEIRESLRVSEGEQRRDQDLKNALRGLAALYGQTDRPSQAEPLLSRIVTMDEKEFGPESLAVSVDVAQLANLYTNEGKYDAALPLLQRRLEIVETNNQPDSASVRKRKDLVAGLDYVLMVPQLPVTVMTQGLISPAGIPVRRPDQRGVFDCYKDLAKGYANAAKYPEAEGMYKQIVAAEDKKADPNRLVETIVLFDDLIDFSKVYRKEHKYDDALETIRRSQALAQQIGNSRFEKENQKLTGPPVYPWLSEIELAETYREKGDTALAEPAFEQSMQMVKHLKLAPGHPKAAESLSNYATLLRDEGKYEQSEALYKRSLETWARSRHQESPEVAETLMNYAALLRKVDRPAEADALEARASAIHAKTHPASAVN